MVRVQLLLNSPTKNPVAEKLVLVFNYESLVKNACNKFNCKEQKVRFFVAKTTVSAKVGTEILNQEDFNKYMIDDIMLFVSKGEDIKRKVIKSVDGSENQAQLRSPPGGKILKKILQEQKCTNYSSISHVNASQIMSKSTANNSAVNSSAVNSQSATTSYTIHQNPSCIKELRNGFPVLQGNVYSLIKKAVEKVDKITITKYDEYISFDYGDNMIFLESATWDSAILKECRGLLLSAKTGEVLARRFHKFFNVNERDETSISSIKKSGVLDDCSIYEKLDGTLTSPILIDGNLMWITRKERNYEIEHFVNNSLVDYTTFCKTDLLNGITPIFEFCHDTKPVSVLTYPKKQLILTARRDNVTGQYYQINDVTDVDTAFNFSNNDIYDTLISVKNMTNVEGIVIYTKNNELYKFKTSWYLNMVRSQMSGDCGFLLSYAKESKSLVDVPENKMFMSAIVNNDDTNSDICSILNNVDAIEYRKFVNIVQQNINYLELQLKQWFDDSLKMTEDVNVIMNVGLAGGWDVDILLNISEQKNITSKLKKFLCFLAKNNTLILNELLNVKWKNGKSNIDNIILDVEFENCNLEIANHVIDKYIPKKISTLLGIKKIDNDTIVNIPETYCGNEGKIMGMYEKISEKYGIHDLRVDLQPQRKEYNDHYGDSEYALFLIQSGKTNEKSVTHAGVLVPTCCDYRFSDISNAFDCSFANAKLVKMMKSNVYMSKKIFCDLDGVLVDFENGVFKVTGKKVEHQQIGKLWQRITNHSNFFESLDFTTYGEELWNEICKVSNTVPTILTGIPSSSNNKFANDKKKWCEKNLGSHVDVITCNSKDKCNYASEGSILIDDRIEMGRSWINNGGIFIHHISYERTIYELKKIYGKIEKINIREKIISEKIISDNKTPNNTNISTLINPKIITDNWIIPDVDIIAIDSEWNHMMSKHNVSIIQIATYTDVYIIDMINCNEPVKEKLFSVLENNNVTKLCFSMSEHECNIIGCSINNAIDLQEFGINYLSDFSNKNLPSLQDLVTYIMGENIIKPKEIQLSNWDNRPLTCDQLTYAAQDVTILFPIYENFVNNGLDMPATNVCTSKTVTIPKRKNVIDIDMNVPVELLYMGTFLTESSQNELLSVIKPTHKNKYGNVAIIKQFPNINDVNDIHLGNLTHVHIIEVCDNDTLQLAKCIIEDTYECYILISSSEIMCNQMFSYDEITGTKRNISIKLFGINGTLVQQTKHELCMLSDKIRKKIFVFERSASPNESIKFKPTELSAMERSAIHEYAKTHNMTSYSSGNTQTRQLTLVMRRKTMNSSLTSKIINEQKQLKITDKTQLDSLVILSPSNSSNSSNSSNLHEKHTSDDRGNYDNIFMDSINYSGKIFNCDHQNDQNDQKVLEITNERLVKKLEYPKKLIILRGLPGFGKSYLTRAFPDADICSADDYFESTNGYEFDKKLLGKAHDFCYNTCLERFHQEVGTVVIDNTNSTLSEYKKYISAASMLDYISIVLEIKCINRITAEQIVKRSVHDIPLNIAMKMYDRWETDDNAFLIEPYIVSSDSTKLHDLSDLPDSTDLTDLPDSSETHEPFMQWIKTAGLCSNKKTDKTTHMTMKLEGMSIIYLNVPKNMHDEMTRRYANAIDNNESLYLMEICRENEQSKLYFDIDFLNEQYIYMGRVNAMAKILQKIICDLYGSEYCKLYVSGYCGMANGNSKVGFHFNMPDMIVTKEEVLTIRKIFIERLYEHDDINNSDHEISINNSDHEISINNSDHEISKDNSTGNCWENVIDKHVYNNGAGFRMLYSKKVTREQNVERVYKMVAIFDENKKKMNIGTNTYENVKATSILHFK